MGIPVVPGGPGFGFGGATQTAGTAITQLIPPYFGPRTAPIVFAAGAVSPGNPPSAPAPNWYTRSLVTHITTLINNNPAAATQNIRIMRPLNFTTFKTAVAKNTTAISLNTDPGLYSTSYNYPLPGAATAPAVADNAIAANDFVAYQLADGSWRLDTIASGTFAGANLALTTGTPNVTGATIAAGAPLFFFGINTDTDPVTGATQPLIVQASSGNLQTLLGTYNGEGYPAWHPGDPMMVWVQNQTTANTLACVAGDYRQY